MRFSTVAASTLIIASALTALTPSFASGGSSPAPDVQCGRALAPSVDPDGDTIYTFLMPNGSELSTVEPSRDLMGVDGKLDPRRLSQSRASKLGLGPRPLDAAGARQWDAVASGLRHRGEPPQAPCVRPGVHAAQYTHHWAGYAARGATTGEIYYGASSAGTVPNVFLSTCTQETMTQWVGVSEGRLVQAGYIYSQNPGPLHHHPFYEFVGGSWDTGGVVDLVYPTIDEGQRWFFSVRYVDAFRWSVTISNLDTGASQIWSDYHFGGGASAYVGRDGVFISERLTINGQPTQYMNHSTARFRNALVYRANGSQLKMSQQAPDEIFMTRTGNPFSPLLGYPSTLNFSDSNFSENWNACS